jgi:pyrroline-5-carboxylate reductase
MDPADRNRVGIIGAGRLGQAMARTALRAGRSVVIANSRGPGSLTSVVSALGAGASAGTVDQASAAGIVVIAVPRMPLSGENEIELYIDVQRERWQEDPELVVAQPRALAL